MTKKVKRLLETIVGVHAVLQELYGKLPILQKCDTEIAKLIAESEGKDGKI